MKSNSRAPRIARFVIKTLFTLLIIAVNAIIIWRVFFSANIPKELRYMTPTEAGMTAYAQYGNDIVAQNQDQASITKSDSSYGYFSAPQVVFLPQANQVQLVFRYNNSTLEHLQQDYKLTERPDRNAELFDVTLIKTTDLTPQDPNDNTVSANLATTRYFPTAEKTERATTTLYTYYRFVFDGITVDDLTVGVFADVYYNADIDYNKRAYGTLCLYWNEDTWLTYPLSSEDKAALAGKRNED